MPDIGLRISWLMFARNSDFASLAFSSCSVFFRTSASSRTFCRRRKARRHWKAPKKAATRRSPSPVRAGIVRYQGGRILNGQDDAGPTRPESLTTRTASSYRPSLSLAKSIWLLFVGGDQSSLPDRSVWKRRDERLRYSTAAKSKLAELLLAGRFSPNPTLARISGARGIPTAWSSPGTSRSNPSVPPSQTIPRSST